jgi:hypothetical protein
MPKFKNKDNTLTDYSFSCGYIERKENNGISITMWKENCYHVRKHDFNTGKRIYWNAFDTLGKAKKFYKKECKGI